MDTSKPKPPLNGWKLFQRHRRQYAHGRLMEWSEKRDEIAGQLGWPNVSITGKAYTETRDRYIILTSEEVLLSIPEQYCDLFPRVMTVDRLIKDLRLELRVVVWLHYVKSLSLAKIDVHIGCESKRSLHWLWDAQEQMAQALEGLADRIKR